MSCPTNHTIDNLQADPKIEGSVYNDSFKPTLDAIHELAQERGNEIFDGRPSIKKQEYVGNYVNKKIAKLEGSGLNNEGFVQFLNEFEDQFGKVMEFSDHKKTRDALREAAPQLVQSNANIRSFIDDGGDAKVVVEILSEAINNIKGNSFRGRTIKGKMDRFLDDSEKDSTIHDFKEIITGVTGHLLTAPQNLQFTEAFNASVKKRVDGGIMENNSRAAPAVNAMALYSNILIPNPKLDAETRINIAEIKSNAYKEFDGTRTPDLSLEPQEVKRPRGMPESAFENHMAHDMAKQPLFVNHKKLESLFQGHWETVKKVLTEIVNNPRIDSLNGDRRAPKGMGDLIKHVQTTEGMTEVTARTFTYSALQLMAFGDKPFYAKWAIEDNRWNRMSQIGNLHPYSPGMKDILLPAKETDEQLAKGFEKFVKEGQPTSIKRQDNEFGVTDHAELDAITSGPMLMAGIFNKLDIFKRSKWNGRKGLDYYEQAGHAVIKRMKLTPGDRPKKKGVSEGFSHGPNTVISNKEARERSRKFVKELGANARIYGLSDRQMRDNWNDAVKDTKGWSEIHNLFSQKKIEEWRKDKNKSDKAFKIFREEINLSLPPVLVKKLDTVMDNNTLTIKDKEGRDVSVGKARIEPDEIRTYFGLQPNPKAGKVRGPAAALAHTMDAAILAMTVKDLHSVGIPLVPRHDAGVLSTQAGPVFQMAYADNAAFVVEQVKKQLIEWDPTLENEISLRKKINPVKSHTIVNTEG